MRIIAGSARGRTICGPGPRSQGIRPTSDKVRGSIFNILGQWMDALTVLDLYAGTGALALEALSRGAERAVLVDQDRQAVALCRENAQALGFSDRAEVFASPVDRACARLAREGRTFDLIFADPPYADGALAQVVALVERHRLVTATGRVVVEHVAGEEPPAQTWLARQDVREFGDTAVSFFSVS